MKKTIIHNKPERKPSLVPPVIATLASLLLPGLGQILARYVRRGLLLILALSGILGLTVTRFKATARFDKTPIDIFWKALRLQPVLIIIVLLILFLYIWIARDAFFIAGGKGAPPASLMTTILIIYFALGWQISGIEPVKLITDIDNATPQLLRVLWPWEFAITYPEEFVFGEASIRIPCTEETLIETEPIDEAYIVAYPTCGNLTTIEGREALGRPDGTALHLEGYNFLPEQEAIIMWLDPGRRSFRHRADGKNLYVQPDEDGYFEVDLVLPYVLIAPSAADEAMIWHVSARQLLSVGAPVLSEALLISVEKIIETIFMGMMATAFGIVFAVPVSFFSARNLLSSSSFTMAIYFIVRTILNIIRSIEPMIWAIIFMIGVGLGPFAGVLALTLHSVAALGKLYSEAIESIDSGPIEAIQATGANWLQMVMFAVVPQIIPPFVSFTIYRWDINVRMSTIIGLVGGGGIGFVLIQWIRTTAYDKAGIAVWFIAITVAILDYVSAEIRARFV